jgi:hypothetical protein
MRPGDGLELPDPFEFPLKRPVVLPEVPPPDDLHRAVIPEGVSRQPDFAIRSGPDAALELVIRNKGRASSRC